MLFLSICIVGNNGFVLFSRVPGQGSFQRMRAIFLTNNCFTRQYRIGILVHLLRYNIIQIFEIFLTDQLTSAKL